MKKSRGTLELFILTAEQDPPRSYPPVRAERVPVRILRLQTTAAQYRNMANFASVGQAARGAIIEVWY
jgi:hypothetical protein